jgi:chorismate mutase
VPKTHEHLDALRIKLRKLDEQMLDLLADRTNLICEIAHIKTDLNLPVFDKAREQQNLEHNLKYSNKRVDKIIVVELTGLLAKWSKSIQTNLQTYKDPIE